MRSYQGNAHRRRLAALLVNTALGFGLLVFAFVLVWHVVTFPPGNAWNEIGLVCAVVFAAGGLRQLVPAIKAHIEGGV